MLVSSKQFAAELTDALHKAAHLSYTPSLSTSVPVTADSAWRSGEFALAVAVPVMLVKAPTAAAATAALSSGMTDLLLLELCSIFALFSALSPQCHRYLAWLPLRLRQP
jgi:hypothetical protein